MHPSSEVSQSSGGVRAMVRPVTRSSGQAESRAQSIADSLNTRQWDELTGIVLRRLERRMADELDRRGRRSNPRVL